MVQNEKPKTPPKRETRQPVDVPCASCLGVVCFGFVALAVLVRICNNAIEFY